MRRMDKNIVIGLLTPDTSYACIVKKYEDKDKTKPQLYYVIDNQQKHIADLIKWFGKDVALQEVKRIMRSNGKYIIDMTAYRIKHYNKLQKR